MLKEWRLIISARKGDESVFWKLETDALQKNK